MGRVRLWIELASNDVLKQLTPGHAKILFMIKVSFVLIQIIKYSYFNVKKVNAQYM